MPKANKGDLHINRRDIPFCVGSGKEGEGGRAVPAARLSPAMCPKTRNRTSEGKAKEVFISSNYASLLL